MIANSVPSSTIGIVFDERRAQVVRDGLLVRERDAQVPVRELLQVDDVLLELRLVEAELAPQRLAGLRGRVRDAREVRDASPGASRKRTKLSVIATKIVTSAKRTRLTT